MSEPCTARIKNQHSDEHCVLEVGHEDPEYGTEHAGPEHSVGGRLRWSDSAVGAVPHQPAPARSADTDTCRSVEVDGETVRFRGSGELTEEGQQAVAALVRVAKAKFVAEAPEQVGVLQKRLRLAHQARRAKEHQLDGIRRALCDAGFMEDDDPYGHADLEEVIRQAGRTVESPLPEGAAANPVPLPEDSATNPAADALSAELCRRSHRLGQLMDDSNALESVRDQVYGEVLALRGAIGIVLGHQVADGDADAKGIGYYEAWCARQESL